MQASKMRRRRLGATLLLAGLAAFLASIAHAGNGSRPAPWGKRASYVDSDGRRWIGKHLLMREALTPTERRLYRASSRAGGTVAEHARDFAWEKSEPVDWRLDDRIIQSRFEPLLDGLRDSLERAETRARRGRPRARDVTAVAVAAYELWSGTINRTTTGREQIEMKKLGQRAAELVNKGDFLRAAARPLARMYRNEINEEDKQTLRALVHFAEPERLYAELRQRLRPSARRLIAAINASRRHPWDPNSEYEKNLRSAMREAAWIGHCVQTLALFTKSGIESRDIYEERNPAASANSREQLDALFMKGVRLNSYGRSEANLAANARNLDEHPRQKDWITYAAEDLCSIMR